MPPSPSIIPFYTTHHHLTTPRRDNGPTIFAEVKHGKGVDHIVGLLLSAWKASGAYEVSRQRRKRNIQQQQQQSQAQAQAQAQVRALAQAQAQVREAQAQAQVQT